MPAGRPTTFTKPVGDAIIAAILEDGCSRTAAAESQGVDESTVRAWEKENPEFSREMKKARGSIKREAARQLKESANKGEVAARIFRAKCLDPEQWTERRDNQAQDAAAFAEAVRAYMQAAQSRDGLEPERD